VSFIASRCTNSWSDMPPVAATLGMSVRNESTMTMRGANFSTLATMASRTRPRSLVSASSVRFAKWTRLFTFDMSKNENCC
jgi:hypothetical protein